MLEFYAIEAPLAQPRNAILGQALAAVIGVSVSKLFALSSSAESLRWLAAALSCASATAVMALTGTVHPPAGATALMAVADDGIAGLGWFLIPVVLLGCAVMLCTALVVNNVQRRFPIYWWTPEEVGSFWRREKESSTPDTEVGVEFMVMSAGTEGSLEFGDSPGQVIIKKKVVIVPDNMYLRPEERLMLESLSLRL